ncbi:hypothetical protein GQ651_13435 [Alphaproteobacteria bacterium GH1-50]|uniref:Uncharacterized protein n=1 Tax=Kangsaoukella pontilimi TaxID=2691042 RepID=A0A7C9ML05_9RHOB|nr:hypothetical protein [Kangsaoukella pontilimi]MXQ08855.1 hypothetical protein [Kangsaoukella pontilimi]
MDEPRIKHLEFIQGVVNRLSTNSFLLKGWTVLIVTALLSFAVNQGSLGLGLFSIVPLAVFWGLDGYFLWEERKYRAHYERVRKNTDIPVNFDMNASDLSIDVGGWISATFSKTLVAFHGIILLSIIAAASYELGLFQWLRESSSASTIQMTPGEQAK